MHGARRGWKRGRGKGRARAKESERARERERERVMLCSCIRVQICVSLCCLLSYFISLGRSKHTIQSLLFKFPRRTPLNYTGTEIPVPSDLCIGVCWLQHGWLVP